MSKHNFSTIRHPLKRAVAKQMGGVDVLYECAANINRDGISGGFSGFIYYTDTVAFTTRHRKAILAMLAEDANSCGVSIIELLSGFRCLNGWTADEIAEGLYNYRADSRTQVYNALAWYAAESVCAVLEN